MCLVDEELLVLCFCLGWTCNLGCVGSFCRLFVRSSLYGIDNVRYEYRRITRTGMLM